ncbi:uncharacterized protein [Amphiura filiformis]|uniref:uncharacterized protein n=1 Tax=Amphiura filiformis TaxID=82378 RepID=UPI003B20BFCD
MSQKQHRKCLTNLVKEVNEEDMLVYLYGCAKQEQLLKWDSAVQTDTSWKKLVYVWTPELLSFHINAIHDQLPSPANLKLGGQSWTVPTLQLPYSLENGRYNWRHDQTLRTIESGLAPYIDEANNSKTTEYIPDFIPTTAFRTADGTTFRNPPLRTPKIEVKNIPKKARDWTFLMDEEHKPIVFPQEIAGIAKRPDFTIYSAITKHVIIIIDSTIGGEPSQCVRQENMKCKYEDLIAECENRGYTVFYFPVEVGSRGFYNTSLTKCLAALGVPKGKRKPVLDTASKSALRASYII